MPRNQKGGNKSKRGKNSRPVKTRKLDEIAKDFDPKEYESYGRVTKELGNKRFNVRCQKHEYPDELIEIVCSLKGSFRKRIHRDSYVLIKLYEFNQRQGQIIDVYNDDELEQLKNNELWDFPEELLLEEKQEIDLPSNSDSDSDSDSEPDDESKSASAAAPEAEEDLDIDAI